MYGQGVNFMRHQILDLIIHQPMAGYGRFAAKRLGRNVDAVMACAAAGTSMASMEMGFIFDAQL